MEKVNYCPNNIADLPFFFFNQKFNLKEVGVTLVIKIMESS